MNIPYHKGVLHMHRVLLIDDEPLVRMTIKSLGSWEKYGFQMAGEAHDGIDALDKLKTEKSFDIILTDISMPRMSGIEVIRQMTTVGRSDSNCCLERLQRLPFCERGL